MRDDRTEGEIQDATVRELRKLGFKVWVTSQKKKTQATPGIADLIVMGRGRVVFLEMKRRLGQQEEAQADFEKAVLENGGRYFIARSEVEAIECLTRPFRGSTMSLP